MRFAPLIVLALAGCAPGLRVDGAAPATLAPGGTLTVRGAGFADGLSLSLTGPGVAVTLQAVRVTSAGAATATVPDAAPGGLYDVTAKLDGDAATLAQAVRVVPGGMQVDFVDIGQGDGSLVIAPTGEVLLLDGGPRDAGPAMRDAVKTLAGGRIDAVVLSHTDADHISGMVAVLAGDDGIPGTDDDVVPAQRFTYVDDGSCTSQICDDARKLRAWPFSVPHPGDKIALGDVDVTIVASDGDVGDGKIASTDTDNERCVVVTARYGGRTVLIGGDVTGGGDGDADVEGPLAQKTGPVDVLRVSHHGSDTSSNAAALAAWQPRALVMSVGTDNAYCHPAAPALARLAATGAPIYATGDGMVSDRCGAATEWPAQAKHGLGTISLVVDASGAMTLAGDAL